MEGKAMLEIDRIRERAQLRITMGTRDTQLIADNARDKALAVALWAVVDQLQEVADRSREGDQRFMAHALESMAFHFSRDLRRAGMERPDADDGR